VSLDRRFLRQIGATVAAVFLLAGYPLIRYGSSEVIAGVLIGAALSTLNVMLGYLAIEYAYEKSFTVFLRTVMGGMGLRLLLMLGSMTALILLFRVHAAALTVSVLGFYMIFLVLEVLFLQRKVLVRNQR
jgi:hypothetical protein